MSTNSTNNDNNNNDDKNKDESVDTGPDASDKRCEKRQRHSRWPSVLLVVGLITLALLLTGCDVPNADPPCSGTNRNQPGCSDPTGQGLKDQGNGGEWYDKWAFDIIRRFASSAAINSVGAGISIFWKIFTTLGSTDFVNCTAGSPQCLAVGVLNNIKIVAMVFFPLILSWKFFKSYIVGAFVDSVYESAFSFVPKVIISIIAITLLDVIITGAFGMSNLLFTTIIGNPQGLANASSGILGESNCVNQSGGAPVSCTVSGIYTIQTVQDVGLVLLMMIVCFLVALAYVALGICFFFRTILIMIMLCLSPLAVVAATTDESKPWFGKWLAGLQSLLVAPIPVAVCLALVGAFLGGDGIPPAHEDPAGFLLRLVYVLSFLAIGSLMMFRIAGQTGGALYGLAVAGASALGGYAVGKLGAGAALGGSGAGGAASQPALAGGSSGLIVDTGGMSGYNPTPDSGYAGGGGGGRYRASASMAGAGEGGGGGYYQQSQAEMVAAIRAMNANNLAGMMYSNSSASANAAGYAPGGGIGSRTDAGNGFHHGTHRNLQNAGHWAGRQVGLDAPQISFAPEYGSRSGQSGSGSGGYSGGPYPYPYPASATRSLVPADASPQAGSNESESESEGEGGFDWFGGWGGGDGPDPSNPNSDGATSTPNSNSNSSGGSWPTVEGGPTTRQPDRYGDQGYTRPSRSYTSTSTAAQAQAPVTATTTNSVVPQVGSGSSNTGSNGSSNEIVSERRPINRTANQSASSNSPNAFGSRQPNVPSISQLTQTNSPSPANSSNATEPDPGYQKVQERWHKRTPGVPPTPQPQPSAGAANEEGVPEQGKREEEVNPDE